MPRCRCSFIFGVINLIFNEIDMLFSVSCDRFLTAIPDSSCAYIVEAALRGSRCFFSLVCSPVWDCEPSVANLALYQVCSLTSLMTQTARGRASSKRCSSTIEPFPLGHHEQAQHTANRGTLTFFPNRRAITAGKCCSAKRFFLGHHEQAEHTAKC